MPIQSCTLPSGKKGFKWGASGKCFPFKKQALAQMKAIFASGYKEKSISGYKEKTNMPKQLFDINVFEVTLCKSPAIGEEAQFKIIRKANAFDNIPEGFVRFERSVKICKVDKVNKIVYGYVLIPDVEDSQEDIVSVEDVEKAAHSFVKNLSLNKKFGTGTGIEHVTFDPNGEEIGYPVESYIDKSGEYGIENAWLLATHITNDDVWSQIEKGEITGYSMGGIGKRVEVESVEKATFNENLEKPGTDAVYMLLGLMTHALTHSIDDVTFDGELDKPEKKALYIKAINDFKTAFLAALDSFGITKTAEEVFKSEKSLASAVEELKKVGKKISSKNLKGLKAAMDTLQSVIGTAEDSSSDKSMKKTQNQNSNLGEQDMDQEAIQKIIESTVRKFHDENVKPQLDKIEEIGKSIDTLVTSVEKIATASSNSNPADKDKSSEEVTKTEDAIATLKTEFEKTVDEFKNSLEALEGKAGMSEESVEKITEKNAEAIIKALKEGLKKFEKNVQEGFEKLDKRVSVVEVVKGRKTALSGADTGIEEKVDEYEEIVKAGKELFKETAFDFKLDG